jgi:hypothetical protein
MTTTLVGLMPPGRFGTRHGGLSAFHRRGSVREHDGYWWVECGTCDTAWQVPHYAESG